MRHITELQNTVVTVTTKVHLALVKFCTSSCLDVMLKSCLFSKNYRLQLKFMHVYTASFTA